MKKFLAWFLLLSIYLTLIYTLIIWPFMNRPVIKLKERNKGEVRMECFRGK